MGRLPLWIWKFEGSLEIWWDFFYWAGPTCQWPTFAFDSPGRLPGPARHPIPYDRTHRVESHSAPVAAGHCRPTWAGLLIAALGHHYRRPPPTPLFPRTIRPPPPRCSTPQWPLHRRHHQPLMSCLWVVRPDQKKHLVTSPLLHREPAYGVD
jgi:hypothetical protein